MHSIDYIRFPEKILELLKGKKHFQEGWPLGQKPEGGFCFIMLLRSVWKKNICLKK
jgi:hypothetical protein